MRALLLGFTSLTLAVGWASQQAPAGSPRAREVVRGLDLAWADLIDLPREAGSPSTGSPLAGVACVAPAEASAASEAAARVVASDSRPVPVDLAVVDGETGASLTFATEITLTRADGLDVPRAPPPPPQRPDPEAPPPDPVPWVPGAAYAAPATQVFLGVKVVAPDGYVADDEGVYSGSGLVSRRATRLRMLAPLRHEANVHVRVLDSGGRPVSGARAAWAYLAGPEPRVVPGSWDDLEVELLSPPEDVHDVDQESDRTVRCESGPSGEDGWTRVRGLPHLLDERFWVVAREGRREGFAGITLGGLGERSDTELRLPDGPSHVEREFDCSWARG